MYLLTGITDEAADRIEDQVAVLHTLGWSAMELRTVDSKLAHELTDEEFSRVADYLEEQQISVPCFASGIANWAKPVHEDFNVTKSAVKRSITRMNRLGSKLVRIMSYQVLQDADGRILEDQMEEERFRRLNWVTQAFLDQGMTPVHENCHTYGGLSSSHTLRMLEHCPGMKLVFDTGNPPITIDADSPFPYTAQNSFKFYNAVKEHVVHVHVKDAYWSSDLEKVEHYTFPGEGRGDVRKILAALQQDGYKGYYSIEPHMEVVFHDSKAVSTKDRRIANFVEYGRRLERLLAETKPH